LLIAIPPPRAVPGRASQPLPPSKPPKEEPIDVTDDAVRELSVADAPAFLPLPESAPARVEPPAPPVALAADDEAAPPVGDAGLFAPPSLLVRAKGLARDAGKKAAETASLLFERAKELQRRNPKAAIVYA